MKISIVKYKQFFTITANSFDKLSYLLIRFNKPLITFKQVRKGKHVTYEQDKTYFVKDLRLSLMRYPISKYDNIIDYLNSVGVMDIDVTEVNPPKGKNIKINTTYNFTLKKYQVEYNQYLKITDLGAALLALPTGYGKTVTVLTLLSKFKKRFGIFVLPRYISKWVDDVTNYTDIEEKDIYIVDSGKALNKLMFYNKEEMGHIKVIIFSLKTLQVYMKKWLDPYIDFDYNLEPDELTSFINLGYIINDETHQDFHNVFTTQLFFNTNMFIGITATLESNDTKMMGLYDVLFPSDTRAIIDIPINRYITAVSVKYYFKDMKRIRFKGPFGYNHNTLEATIIKSRNILNNYLEMIMRITLGGYMRDRIDNDKMLIFVSKVETCVLLIDFFKSSGFFKDLNITKYTEEDDYKVIAANDIIISTQGSAGTALDIPNLVAVIQTVAIDSIQANKQSLGRLRDLEDRDVKFYYIWSGNIPQHGGYNFRRMKYFNSLAKTFINKVYQKSI